MSNETETIEQEEIVDETPLDEEVGDDEIIPESDEDLSEPVEEEGELDGQEEEYPPGEPQTPDHVQQQLNALTQQNAQAMQYMQGLAQAMTQMSQRQQGPAPAQPVAPAPSADLDSMSSSDLVRHIQTLTQAQFAQPMANTAKQMQGVLFRMNQLGEAVAFLGKTNPDFQHLNAAFELMQRVPGTQFEYAMKAVKGLAMAEQNTTLQKKQKQQEKHHEKRKRKAKGQGRRPDNRPKRPKEAKSVPEAMEQLEKEGFFGGQK